MFQNHIREHTCYVHGMLTFLSSVEKYEGKEIPEQEAVKVFCTSDFKVHIAWLPWPVFGVLNILINIFKKEPCIGYYNLADMS